ncbi:probable cytochrome P450 6d4 [Uranotaenia lowii]|uniref:probable cytochrome P450 6d4 n=1 Tax=Uranotaenia lowii TaxID=190385 RepID=UPI00247B1F46|nr:probable cytochrome P450 6d4 [Uranotaenia lowii]
MINDPDLVKDVLVRNFSHFYDRGMRVDESVDPLGGHLFALSGEKWKHLRTKLGPAFTSGKLKAMFPTLLKIGEVMLDHVGRNGSGMIDVRELSARYSTDIIASVGFGIETDSINNEDEIFRRMGSKFFALTLKNMFRLGSFFFFPKLLTTLRMKHVDQEVEDFIFNLVQGTMEYRESNGIVRKDMMQLLLQLRNTGAVAEDDRWDVGVSKNSKTLSLPEISAQAFVFFIAAYETSSTAMAFCLYEVAKNKTIQRKAQEELDEILSINQGKFDYESVVKMQYLDKCIKETMRKYPSPPFLNRECTKDYRIPGTNTIIKKGTIVIISTLGLQRDEQFYPNPEEFIPERFDHFEDSNSKVPYYPFGDGPRICIGMRLGQLQVKLGLALLLSRFNLELVDESQRTGELKLSPKSILLTPVDGINLKLQERILNGCRKL